MNANRISRILVTLCLLVILVISTGCNGTPTVVSTATPVPPNHVTQGATNTEAGSVTRILPRVWAGQTTPLPELTNNLSATLPANSIIYTNQGGIAKLLLGVCSPIYLYNNGSLQKGSCQPNSQGSGNWMCNGAISINCSSKLSIYTPSAAIELSGTWLTVIYLPDTQLTIVQVFRGAVSVIPAQVVANAGETTNFNLPATTVNEGFFWFTTPGNVSLPIGNFSGRSEIPFEQWPQFKGGILNFDPQDGAKLDNWMSQINLRAIIDDGQTLPNFFLQDTVLNGVGPLIEIPEVQDAILSAVDWSQFTPQTFPERTSRLAAVFPGSNISFQTSWTYNFNFALTTIKALNLSDSQRTLTIVIPTYNDNFVNFNDHIVSSFREIGLQVTVVPVNPAELNIMLGGLLKEGASVLWISENWIQP
jgi:hypothetical protein